MSLREQIQRAIGARYTIGDEIGRGGMAAVFAALDSRHDRQVAVKVLLPAVADVLGADRFIREIRIVARLVHPHILPLHDSGESNGMLYYVMPLVQGESLRDVLNREKRLSPERALPIVQGVASALAYAHGHGVVHRDVKPENILVVDGEALVADFGIAKVLGPTTATMTEVGLSVGTPDYMSPEQALGEELDGRSDIYSLGCVLFELLVGSAPFSGPTAMAVTAKKLIGPAPNVTSLVQDVSVPIARAVARALAQSPAERYASATEFDEALRAAVVAGHTGTAEALPSTARRPVSIAVLPFANLSGDPAHEFLSDGLADDLIHALTRIRGLRVVARTSAFAYKGATDDVRKIGRTLGVGTVLEGSVRFAGNRLRVTTQLINVTDGCQLWSERYDREVTDVFGVQDEIARTAVDHLRIELMDDEQPVASSRDHDPAAYALYLRGRHAWNRRTEESLHESLALLQQAIERDPSFALGHAAIAEVLATAGVYGAIAPGKAMPDAARAAQRARALDPTLAEPHAAIACVRGMHQWDWAGAETEFRTLFEGHPGYALGRYWYAMNVLAPLGRFEEARDQLVRAGALDPVSPSVHVSRAIVAYYERETEQALTAVDDALAVSPTFPMAFYIRGKVLDLAEAWDEARGSFEKAIELGGRSPEFLAALGHSEARAGRAVFARERLTELNVLRGQRYVSPVCPAVVLVGLGRVDEALERLKEAAEVRAADLVWAGVRPTFSDHRTKPRWAELFASIGIGVDSPGADATRQT